MKKRHFSLFVLATVCLFGCQEKLINDEPGSHVLGKDPTIHKPGEIQGCDCTGNYGAECASQCASKCKCDGTDDAECASQCGSACDCNGDYVTECISKCGPKCDCDGDYGTECISKCGPKCDCDGDYGTECISKCGPKCKCDGTDGVECASKCGSACDCDGDYGTECVSQCGPKCDCDGDYGTECVSKCGPKCKCDGSDGAECASKCGSACDCNGDYGSECEEECGALGIADDAPIVSEKVVEGVSYPILPLTYKPFTTLQIAFRPTFGTQDYSMSYVHSKIAAHEFKVIHKDDYKKYGLGIEETDGEPWIVREDLVRASDPELSHKGKSLAYFWQISDPQIIDEESPCRMEGVYIYPYAMASAYRAQGIYSTHMFDLHVQSARRISDRSSRRFDFALVTGDIADNAQENENAWFLRMMEGGVLDPDTGIDDDPEPGPGNDFNDPYYAKGIGNIPWYPAIGNHDILYMGFHVVDDKIRNACVGDEVVDLFDYMPLPSHAHRDGYRNGFQNGASPDAAIVTSGKTPADPHRKNLSKVETLTNFYNAPGFPAGHGLDPERIKTGWGYYSTFPIPGKPIRLITLDTNSGTFSEADMSRTQFDWLSAEIEEARKNNELVIVQSHHGTAKLANNVTQEEFQKKLASYPGVILHITGHGHLNDSLLYKNNYGRGYWEVMLASVVDFPSQSRIFEIVYEGNGIIDIYITNIDPNAPKNTFVRTAMEYASARRFFGSDDAPEKIIKAWDDEKEHRNLILRTRVPEEIWKNLENYEWSDVIESETTLQNFRFETTKE